MTKEEMRFATSDEIAAELGKRAKHLRVNVLKVKQEDFAKKIGMPRSRYQGFEQKGDIRLSDLITIARYLKRFDDVAMLFEAEDIESLGIEAFRESDGKRKQRVR